MKYLKIFEDYKKNYVFDFQDKNGEVVVHRDWKGSNVWRYKFENAGDILREFTKYRPSKGYIFEKLRKIENFLNEVNNLHIDDTYETCVNNNPVNIEDIRKAYETQPYETQPQKIAIKLTLSLINNKIDSAIFYTNYIINNFEKLQAETEKYYL